MKSNFSSLLAQAGFDTSEPGFWQRVVMIDNLGLLPAQRLEEGDVTKLRGFNALVLDRHGEPTHFCKCRPPTKDWIRQTELCVRMSREPALRHTIPSVRGVGSADMYMAISAYVPGRVFESTVPWMTPAKLDAALHEILREVETIARCGLIVDPDVFGGQTHVDLAAEVAWAFDAIPPSLLAPAQAVVLQGAIAAVGKVRRTLQHGDLWARNILWHDGHWWLLDLDTFGRIQVPLYDVFHLVRCCWVLRQTKRATRWSFGPVRLPNPFPSWVQHLRSSAMMDAGPRILRWARLRQGLTEVEAVGALAFYLIDTVARMCRRRLRMIYVEPYLSDLSVLAHCLEAGETFTEAFGADDAEPGPSSLEPSRGQGAPDPI